MLCEGLSVSEWTRAYLQQPVIAVLPLMIAALASNDNLQQALVSAL